MKQFILLQRLSMTPLSPQQARTQTNKVIAVIQHLVTQGKFVSGSVLPGRYPAAVRFGAEGFKVSGNEARVVTPGVVIEHGETMGACIIVRVADINEAVEIAKSLPNIDFGGSVEVREILPAPTTDAAIAVCKENVQNDPQSASANDSLSCAYLLANRVELALENMEKTLTLEPNSTQRQAWISWLREYIRVQKEPARVPTATLQRYAGSYEGSHVALKDDSLYWEDAGGSKSCRLIPLSENTFEVDGEAWLRICFIASEREQASRIALLYMEDRQVEIARDSVFAH